MKEIFDNWKTFLFMFKINIRMVKLFNIDSDIATLWRKETATPPNLKKNKMKFFSLSLK